MSRLRIVFAIILTIMLSLTPLARGEGPTFRVDEIVEAIKLEIMGAQAIEEGNPKIQIKSFSLALAVVAEKTTKGVLEFQVPGIEEGASKGFSISTTHIVNISMSVSEKASVTPIASNLGILPAIQSIKSALRNAYSARPVFETSALNVTIEFAVVRTDKQSYVFHVIEAGKPEYKSFATHKLTIHMSVVN